jgi:hypothetical protein
VRAAAALAFRAACCCARRCTLRAICSLFPSLESLDTEFPVYESFRDPRYRKDSEDFVVALAGAGDASLPLPLLRKLKIPRFASSRHNFSESLWNSLEDFETYDSPMLVQTIVFPLAQRPNLRVLRLSFKFLANLEALLESDMPNLEVLELYMGCRGGAALVRQGVAKWPRLRVLQLQHVFDDKNDMSAFMEGLLMPSISYLDIELAQDAYMLASLGPTAVRCWPNLTSLKCILVDNADDISVFGASNHWNLESLDLNAPIHVIKALGTLPATAALRSLRTLHLSTDYMGTTIPSKMPAALFSGSWSALEDLKLEYCHFGVSAATALSKAVQEGRLSRLRKLDLCECEFAPGAIKALCAAPFEALEVLSLSRAVEKIPNSFKDADVLAQSAAYFPKLHCLRIPPVPSVHLERLLSSPWRSLEKVWLTREGDYGKKDVNISIFTMTEWSEINVPDWEPVTAYYPSVEDEAFVKCVRRKV